MSKSERAIKYLASKGAELCWHEPKKGCVEDAFVPIDNSGRPILTIKEYCFLCKKLLGWQDRNPDLSQNTADLRRVIELVPGEWERFTRWIVFHKKGEQAYTCGNHDKFADILTDPALFLEAFDAYITDCEKG